MLRNDLLIGLGTYISLQSQTNTGETKFWDILLLLHFPRYTHFNTLKKTALRKHCGNEQFYLFPQCLKMSIYIEERINSRFTLDQAASASRVNLDESKQYREV